MNITLLCLVSCLLITVSVRAGRITESKVKPKGIEIEPSSENSSTSDSDNSEIKKTSLRTVPTSISAKELKQQIRNKKKASRKTTLDRQLSSIRRDIEDTSEKNANLKEMLKDLKEIHRQRKKLRLLIAGYTFAQLLLHIAQFVPFLNVYLTTGMQGINFFKELVVTPLDVKYYQHQQDYANAVAHFLEKYPEYRKGYKNLPKTLKIKTDEGEEIRLRILKEKINDKLPEDVLHLSNKGIVELATIVTKMK